MLKSNPLQAKAAFAVYCSERGMWLGGGERAFFLPLPIKGPQAFQTSF